MKKENILISKALVWMVLMLGLLLFVISSMKKKHLNHPTSAFSSSPVDLLLEHQEVFLTLDEVAVQIPVVKDYRDQVLKEYVYPKPGKVKANDLKHINLLLNGPHHRSSHLNAKDKAMIQERLKKCR